jgi:hypothetical protein
MLLRNISTDIFGPPDNLNLDFQSRNRLVSPFVLIFAINISNIDLRRGQNSDYWLV